MLRARQKDQPGDMTPFTILFFDSYNAEDPLFVADVARRLPAAVANGLRAIVLHASDEATHRAREALGAADPTTDQVDEVVERAIRMANQSITRRLIDEGVSAVSIQGNHRGLLRLVDGGALEVGRTEWLERTVGMGGVPVISLLAETSHGQAVEVDAAQAIRAMTAALSERRGVTVVYFTTNRKSVLFEADGSRLESVSRTRLSSFEEVPRAAAAAAESPACAVFVTNSAGLRPDGSVAGTQIT
jgi:acetylglutamate kinase